jgi:3-deoxy-manno-octulosonate cytidylyltransferase (CMP-KDO synthetase)
VRAIGVIPARFGSTRFPGKPLVKLNGKPLVQWVIEGARQSRLLDEIWLATDHPEIEALGRSLGVRTVQTPSDLPTGSDRVHHAVKDQACDVVVNIQGDEPLISGQLLDLLVAPMLDDARLQMATLGREINADDLRSPNTAKIVLNHRHEALYFSRHPIPYSREPAPPAGAACLKHIGLYAFRKDFLTEFCAQSPTALESAEGLEQLRALYLGARIKVVKVDHDSWGVDTPDDVAKVEALLTQRTKV